MTEIIGILEAVNYINMVKFKNMHVNCQYLKINMQNEINIAIDQIFFSTLQYSS